MDGKNVIVLINPTVVDVVQELSQVQLFVTPQTQQVRLSCPWLSPWVCSDSCPLNQWCHPIILCSVSSPSLLALNLSQHLTIESVIHVRCPKYWSFSFSISPFSDYSRLISFRITGLISLKSKGLSRVFSNTTVQRHQFLGAQLSLWYNSHIHTWLGKTIALTRWTFVGKVRSLFFNMLSRCVIAFLPRSKHLSISWKHSPSAVILQIQKKKKKVSHCFPVHLPWSDGTRCHYLSFLNVEF